MSISLFLCLVARKRGRKKIWREKLIKNTDFLLFGWKEKGEEKKTKKKVKKTVHIQFSRQNWRENGQKTVMSILKNKILLNKNLTKII